MFSLSLRAAALPAIEQTALTMVDTGVFLATSANRNDPAIRRLLVPDLSVLDE